MRTLLLSMLVVVAALTGCKKEGCTDPDAKNYNSKARTNDGTCLYEGQAVIWYGQYTANQLYNDDAYSLNVYLDGQVVGSSSTSIYWTGAPNCGDNGSITITRDLGSVKNKSFSYSVRDQTGFLYWSGTLIFNANQCNSLELVW